MPQTKELLDLKFANQPLKDLLEELGDFLHDYKNKYQYYVATPNPEILLEAAVDTEFAAVLVGAWFHCADGFGVQWADWFGQKFGKRSVFLRRLFCYPSLFWFAVWSKRRSVIVPRITGVDLLAKMLTHLSDVPVFLLGAAPGVAEQVVKNYPFAKIVGTYAGSPAENEQVELVQMINNTDARVLFVAYGAPAQEKWIARNYKKLSSVKLSIGVGGAFDFLAENVKRAPLFMRKVGLEWLWRLFSQPWRWKRIWRAVVVYPWWVSSKT